MLRVLEAAAPTDQSLVELREQHAAQRLSGMRRFAGHLDDQGALAAELSVDRAADILWTLCAQRMDVSGIRRLALAVPDLGPAADLSIRP